VSPRNEEEKRRKKRKKEKRKKGDYVYKLYIFVLRLENCDLYRGSPPWIRRATM
jgi:hypothetical protein